MFSLETFIFCAGIIYLTKLSLNLLWDIKNGFYAYILPRMYSINYKKKYGGWAVVTGCTQGIGKCYAEELAQKGLNVVLISRTQSKLETVANELRQKYGMIKFVWSIYSKSNVKQYNSCMFVLRYIY